MDEIKFNHEEEIELIEEMTSLLSLLCSHFDMNKILTHVEFLTYFSLTISKSKSFKKYEEMTKNDNDN